MADFRIRWIDWFSVSDPGQTTARLRIIHALIKNRERHLIVMLNIASVLSDVTEEKLDLLRAADAVYIDEIREAGLYDDIWQAFSVLLPVRSVGVMGDERTYENVLGLRAVMSTDGMTADWFPFPHDVLARISSRISNQVKGINRVVYDVSSKPPATIEWE